MTRANGTLLAGAVVLMAAAGFLVSHQFHAPATAGARKNESLPAREAPKPVRRQVESRWGNLPELPPASLPPHPPGSSENEAWITGRVAALDDAAWLDDPEAMRSILAELRNPLPELRAAARAAITAFGSDEAVPYLEMTAATTYDETERQELAKVIDFLKLPTVAGHLGGQDAGPSSSAGETISK
jgi:hypothetical protein